MKNFDFRRIFGNSNDSNSASKKRVKKQRRGRTCRIEELEGREMLSVTPWTLADDDFNLSQATENETVIVDNTLPDSLNPLAVAPSELRYTTYNATSVSLAWNSVDFAQAYQVRWKPASSSTWTERGNVQSLTDIVNGLTPDTITYEFQVRVRVGGTWNEWSASIFVPTPPPPPALPTLSNFRSTGSTHNSVSLEWSFSGTVTTYTLEYRVSGTTTWSTWSPAPGTSATKATVGNATTLLLSNTTYEFRLTATNSSGSNSAITTGTTKEGKGDPEDNDLPDFPFDIESGSNCLIITWGGGTGPGIDFRWLQYKESTSDAWMTWYTSSQPTSPTTIAGLKSGALYDIRLVDVCGESATQLKMQSTLVGVGTAADAVKPKPAVKVAGKHATTNSVTLNLPANDGKNKVAANAVYVINVTKIGKVKDPAQFPKDIITSFTVDVTGLEQVKVGKNMMVQVQYPPCLMPNTSYKFSVTALNALGEATIAKKKNGDPKLKNGVPTITSVVNVTAKTAKYAAVTKAKMVRAGDIVTLTWKTPTKPALGAGYTEYEFVWLQNKNDVVGIPIAITPTQTGGNKWSATIAVSDLLALTGNGLDPTKTNTFVIRAITGDTHHTDHHIAKSVNAKYTLAKKILL